MNWKFKFKEIDYEGLDTLDSLSDAKSFNKWMFDDVVSECSGKILEIGSGIGNISEFFIERNLNIWLSDVRINYLDFLKSKFKSYEDAILNLDAVHPDFENEYASLLNSFDYVFSLNVIEHIENDELAVNNIVKLLKPGGRCIILVPAFNFLYNSIDKSLYHYRRYNKELLTSLAPKNTGLIKSYYFNFSGIPAWFIGGKIFNESKVTKSKMNLFNSFVPVWKIIDKLVFRKVGLSVVMVLERI